MIQVTNPEQVFDRQKVYDTLFSIIPGIEKAASVPVLHAATLPARVFRKNYVNNNQPCLIREAVQHWPAVKKWKDKHYWTSACNNFEVMVYPHQNYNDENIRHGERMPFHDAIERLFLHADPVFSIPAEQVAEGRRFSPLIKDMGGFSFLEGDKPPLEYDRRRIFIYRCAATAWHYHAIDETLMCQVNGNKKVALLPPHIPKAKAVTAYLQEERYLHGTALDHSLALRPRVVDVAEGDALYIPPFWFHAVIPNDNEVGYTLAYCWRSPWHKLGDFSNYFVRTLYRKGCLPVRKDTFLLPFIACYAGLLHYTRSSKRFFRNPAG